MTSQHSSSPPPAPSRQLVRPPDVAQVATRAGVVACVLAMMAAVAFLVRNDLYTEVASAAAGSAMESSVGLVAEAGVLVLVATAGLLAAWTWLRERHSFLILASAGVGVVGTYATSEVVKLLIAAQRPCRTLDIETVLTCPAVGDWSWPSNHATIAGGFATACILVAPRTAWLVVPVAALIAASRVAGGVHYAHDVLSGLALGVLGVTIAVIVLRPLRARLAQVPLFRRP